MFLIYLRVNGQCFFLVHPRWIIVFMREAELCGNPALNCLWHLPLSSANRTCGSDALR